MIRFVPTHSKSQAPASPLRLRLLASGNIKRKLEFILELYGSSGSGNRKNLVVAQAERELTRRSENSIVHRNARRHRLTALDSAQRRSPSKLYNPSPFKARTFVNRILENLPPGDFLPIFLMSSVSQRRPFERTLHS
jgi:hypothetical protein